MALFFRWTTLIDSHSSVLLIILFHGITSSSYAYAHQIGWRFVPPKSFIVWITDVNKLPIKSVLIIFCMFARMQIKLCHVPYLSSFETVAIANQYWILFTFNSSSFIQMNECGIFSQHIPEINFTRIFQWCSAYDLIKHSSLWRVQWMHFHKCSRIRKVHYGFQGM